MSRGAAEVADMAAPVEPANPAALANRANRANRAELANPAELVESAAPAERAEPPSAGAAGQPDGVRVRTVEVNGRPCRVWEKGEGERVGYLAGIGGLARWTPFLDRLAERRRVIAPSVPGFPGAEGHDLLDTQLDWVLAAQDLLEAAGLEGADLVGVSVGAALAADAAACARGLVGRLALVGPLGMFDEAEPVADVWAQRPGDLPALVCSDPERFSAATAAPPGEDPVEAEVLQLRANEAAARLLWPLSDTRLARRLPRIRGPVLLLWGEEDRVVPFGYAERFAAALGGESRIERIPGAGHLADLDAPDDAARRVLAFLDGRA